MTMRRYVTAGVLTATVAAAACGPAGGAERQESGQAERTVRTINVELQTVEPQDFTHFVRVLGTVEAEHDVTVAAEEGGVVRSIAARKGEALSAGEPILRIDDAVLRAQLDQAESQAALAKETWERQRQLWEDEQVGTEMSYLQARYGAQTAEAQARVLRERLQRTVVRSPVKGILDARMVEVGSMVSPGTPVVRILDVDTVRVEAGVPERYATEIERGAEVTVTVDALDGREYQGAIDFVGAAVSGDTRTFPIEVEVPNPGLGIKPGMVANVRISRRTVEDALVVPRHAVLRRENGYVVYVARETEDGWRAEARGVVPGESRGEEVLIRSGLEPGERIVVVGQQRVAHGDALRIASEGTGQ